MRRQRTYAVMASALILMILPLTGWAQWPYPPGESAPPPAPLPPSHPFPQGPMPPGPQYGPQGPPQQQYAPQRPPTSRHPQGHPQGGQYAFRPDLTNPQYGECLMLERQWKDMWRAYANGYQQAQSMNPQDPRYVQLSYYLADLKRKLDAAWYNFSGKCVYFPENLR